ncbi:MAG: enoyl-CoA hydratase/isomerase family protein [Limisphaerales bacterium]
MTNPSQFNIDRTHPGQWTITFSNPPINMFVPTTIVELGALMTDLEADPSVKAVVFQSANPDFFIAHLDVAKAVERPEVLGLWRDFVLRLSSMPVVSIAKIRGRTRGIGNEFVLACVIPARRAYSLPSWLRDWLERWAALRQIQDAALAVIDDDKDDGLTTKVSSELTQFVRKHGLNLITDEGAVGRDAVKLFARLCRERELPPPIERSRFADTVTSDSFRGVGVNE